MIRRVVLGVLVVAIESACAAPSGVPSISPAASTGVPSASPTASPADAAEVCASVAPNWNGTVLAAFSTNLAGVRARTLSNYSPDRWDNQPDSTPATLCYIDGSIPKSPPNGTPFDRAIIAVVGAKVDLIAAGYRDQMAIKSP